MVSSSSVLRRRIKGSRLKERANLSFFIVILFFALFGIIIFTEIFLIDDRGRGAGVLVRHGTLGSGIRQRPYERPDYEDVGPPVDYSLLKGGLVNFDESVKALLRGDSQAWVQRLPAYQQPAPYVPIQGEVAVPNKNEPVLQVLEELLPPYPKNITAKDGDWQIVNGTRFKYFVFSAFYDRRKFHHSVRLIGATKTRAPERVWCRMWYRHQDANSTSSHWTSISVLAKVKAIRENWNLKYSAHFIQCPLAANATSPESVSIVVRPTSFPNNLLLVRNTDQDVDHRFNVTNVPDGIAICVKPLHFEFNRIIQILEFIELNMILGVTHFTFYNHTIGKEVSCVLQDYAERGIVSLYPWQLNMTSQKEIRTEGLFAALNDCLYRSMYRYSHALLIDLDEYVIPRHVVTLTELLRDLDARTNNRRLGYYSFQNAFFYLQWGDDPSTKTDQVDSILVTQRKTRRKSKLHPHKQRSKYICRPEYIVEAGNHFVWEFIPGHGTLNVPSDSAILHHYRVCEFGGNDCIETPSVVDKTAIRYRAKLAKAVADQYKRLSTRCSLPALGKSPATTSAPNSFLSMFGVKSGVVADRERVS